MHGARFTDRHGWRVAEAYTSARDEEVRARAGVGLADVGAGGKLSVRGSAVDAVIATLGAAAPPARTARWTRIAGAEALVCRRAPDEVLVLTDAAEADSVGDQLRGTSAAAGCAHVADLTSGLAAVELVGPAASRLLARLSPLDVAAMPPLGVEQGAVARVTATVIRLDHPDQRAFRLLFGREYGEFVWHSLADAGHTLGLVRMGAAAHRLLQAPRARPGPDPEE
jgi:heterotetrameric sarcosine oxidase gamma subunit